MAKTRPPYPEEFRARIVELNRAGRSIESLAREFEPSSNTISKWVKQARIDAGREVRIGARRLGSRSQEGENPGRARPGVEMEQTACDTIA